MKIGYVDTSCLVAIAFAEPGATKLTRTLSGFDSLLSSNLLEAELRAAVSRERTDEKQTETLLSWVTWVFPQRELTREISQILRFGYLRGADLWHLAVALFVAAEPNRIFFLTLDTRQKVVAKALGFKEL
ncbi:MAG: PIN domain-containing protein [Acidobacteriota bacterium]